MPPDTITLVDIDGSLYVAPADQSAEMREWFRDEHVILVYTHPGGDPDTITTKEPNLEHLRGALYDAREMGIIGSSHVSKVRLPDGREIAF